MREGRGMGGERKREKSKLFNYVKYCTRQPATLAAVGNCVKYEHQ